jgi:GGDEF domain-containing protein
MGLFEKALSYQKKKGLYHRLLELQNQKEEPKSLYLKAKALRKQWENHFDKDIKLPEFKVEEISPKNLDPELYEFEPPKDPIDPFEDWQKEALEEIEKKEFSNEEQLKQKIIEDENEILTLPEEIHVASQKRIDYYLALFDIIEELQEIDDYEELLEAIAFAIQEQLGTRSIVVLGNPDVIKQNKKLPMYFLLDVGYKTLDLTIKEDDPFISYLMDVKQEEIFYVSKLKNFLEQKWKESSLLISQELGSDFWKDFKIYFPIKNNKKIYAIYFLTNPLEQKDYILDDLEFLRILMKATLTRLKRLEKDYELKQNIENIKKFKEYSNSVYKFLVESSSKKTFDELFDLIQAFLEENFRISMFSFVIIHPENNVYKLFSGKNISYQSIQKFEININGDLIGLISNLTTIQDIDNFKEYKEISLNYSEEDLALMEHFIVVPLIHLNWLVGFFAIHKFKGEKLTDLEKEILLYFATMIAPMVTNLIINEERELLFKDIFSPLKNRLEQEIKKAEELHTSFSIIDLKIKNMVRLLSVNSISKMDQFLRNLIEVINGTLYQHDYLVRSGQGRIIIILSGRGKEESQIYIKKLLSKIKEMNLFVESPIQPNFNYDIYTYPKDADNLRKMLALMEN